jgi:hypothetical protein
MKSPKIKAAIKRSGGEKKFARGGGALAAGGLS